MQPAHISKHEEVHYTEPPQEKSLGELFGELMSEFKTLVSQEVALAKAEMSEKASKAGKNIGMIAAGGAVAYAGLLVLLGALVVILVEAGMALWLSALIVGAVVAAIGGYMAKSGMDKLRNMDFAPRQTIESIKETTK